MPQKQPQQHLPTVYSPYAGPQERRILSLLSPVLMKRIRPSAYWSIRNRLATTATDPRSVTPDIPILTLCKGNDETVEYLKQTVVDFSYNLVLTGNDQEDSKQLDAILRRTSPQKPFLFVAAPSACAWLSLYLLERHTSEYLQQYVAGCVFIAPTVNVAHVDLPAIHIVLDNKISNTMFHTKHITVVMPTEFIFRAGRAIQRDTLLWMTRIILHYRQALWTVRQHQQSRL